MLEPRDHSADDQQVVRYLLGMLTDEEVEHLDEASVADDEFASRLRIVEDDLVDGYVRGTLDEATRERFESHYMASPRRRERVRFAENFVRVVQNAPRSRIGPDLQPLTQARSWLLPVAALILLGVSGALGVTALRLQSRLSTALDERASLERRARDLEDRLGDQRAAADAAREDLSRAREVAGAALPATVPDRARGAANPLPVALVLLPQMRSIGNIPTLTIPAGADRVGLRLQLESNDFPQYQVALQDPATQEVLWRSSWLAPETSGAEASVAAAVPTQLLKPQHFSLDLAGRDAAGRTHVVGSYAVQVLPR